MAEAAKKPNANEVYQGLTGTQKCAILMMLSVKMKLQR